MGPLASSAPSSSTTPAFTTRLTPSPGSHSSSTRRSLSDEIFRPRKFIGSAYFHLFKAGVEPKWEDAKWRIYMYCLLVPKSIFYMSENMCADFTTHVPMS